uniref:Uncharacterized protein n=1 Tax=Rhizophora mucronata TaxID=61149 RepID=A0A2P2NMU5_RHIMU
MSKFMCASFLHFDFRCLQFNLHFLRAKNCI